MTTTRPYFRFGLMVALASLVADQLHKWFMLNHTSVTVAPIEVTPFFNLVMVWNTGISFGMFRGSEYSAYIFSSISLIIVFILLFWIKNTKIKCEATAIGFIIGGALGNIIDRLRYGAVADFFDVHVAGYHWPAFNIADSVVFVGAVILCYTALKGNNNEDKDEQK